MIDLVCLVADKNMAAVVQTLLERHESLDIRKIAFKILTHPQHDPGCFGSPAGLLELYVRQAQHGLVVLDRQWDGAPDKTAVELEGDVNGRLCHLGPDWARCVIIDPELEAWLFTRSPRLDEAIGWAGRDPSLGKELAARELWLESAPKPTDPRQALKWALAHVGKQTSSSIYRQIAKHVGVKKCVDPSFHRFRSILQLWFPAL